MGADITSGHRTRVTGLSHDLRRLRLGIVGLVAATAIVLSTAGCGIGQLKPAGRAADAFGAAIADQQWASAAAMVCARDRATVTAATLAYRFSTPAIAGYSSGGVQIRDINGDTTAQAELVSTPRAAWTAT